METIAMVQKELKNLPEFVTAFFGGLWSDALTSISKSEEDVRGFVNKLVERGKLTREDGKHLAQETFKHMKEQRDNLEKRLEKVSEKFFSKINVPGKSEMDRLEVRVDDLISRVAQLKKKANAIR